MGIAAVLLMPFCPQGRGQFGGSAYGRDWSILMLLSTPKHCGIETVPGNHCWQQKCALCTEIWVEKPFPLVQSLLFGHLPLYLVS
jgi:hypothetical protein